MSSRFCAPPGKASCLVERLEGRTLLTATFNVNEVADLALSQPLIYYYLRRPNTTQPIYDTQFGITFTGQAYLDTGTSSVVLSQESAQQFGITSETSNGQPVTFTDIGIGGGENFGVSEPLFTGLAPFNPNTDVDNPSTWQQVYNQEFGPLRMELRQQPSPDPFDPEDIWGMPVMQGKVVVMDPKPIYADPTFPQDMNTYLYNPGTPFNSATANTNPGIPATSLHVKLSYANYFPFTTMTPSTAQPPVFTSNPMIGPSPLAAPGTDHTPPLSFARGSYSGTGSFIFDTGAQTSFMSQAEAAKLHVHYKTGTYGTTAPVLVDDNGNTIPNQTVIPLGGIGGQADVAEFYMDSLTLQTTEGTPIIYHNVPIAVLDIGVTNPTSGQTVVLDGDLGVNFLTATKDGGSAAAFNWITFDQPNGQIGFAPNTTAPTTPTVVGRYLFYNNSVFDGRNPAANAQDDAAIAIDKQPLAQADTAKFVNYTSYSKGINGLMVDVAALPSGHTPAVSDFTFKVGNDSTPNAWAAAPAPSGFLVRPGAGADGSTRIEFTWADGAIRNKWLQVTVTADANTGLSAADVFYFGNAVGESGDSASNAIVNAADVAGARSDPHSFMNPATIDNVHDYNRDGRVDIADQIIARSNATTSATALQLITTPLSGVGATAARAAAASSPLAAKTAAAPPLKPRHRKPAAKAKLLRITLHERALRRLKSGLTDLGLHSLLRAKRKP